MPVPGQETALRCELSVDRKRLRLTFPAVASKELPKPVALSLELGSREVDALLVALARTRARMEDRHPARVERTRLMVGTINPSWQLASDGVRGGSVLSLRHPGFGWLHFSLPKQEATKLGNGLLVQVPMPPIGQLN
jgi:hypothetical protein